MAPPHVIVVGSSAGGFDPLLRLVADLPADLPAAVLVVQHIPADRPSTLPELLSRAGVLPARHPRDGDPLLAGHIYVAPPDHHLLVEGETVGVKKGPRENRFRPAVDALFRSAAYTCGPRVIGVILSGLLSDGCSGLWTLKRLGGRAVVQSPEDAQFDSMPRAALDTVEADHVVPSAELGPLLARLVAAPPPRPLESPMDEHERRRLEVEVGIAADESGLQQGIMALGDLSPFTCPSCQGVLVRFREGHRTRYRCHTGHAYSSDTLLSETTHSVEEKAYQLLRALEETEMLLEELGEQYRAVGEPRSAGAFLGKVGEIEARIRAVREIALTTERLSEDGLRQPLG